MAIKGPTTVRVALSSLITHLPYRCGGWTDRAVGRCWPAACCMKSWCCKHACNTIMIGVSMHAGHCQVAMNTVLSAPTNDNPPSRQVWHCSSRGPDRSRHQSPVSSTATHRASHLATCSAGLPLTAAQILGLGHVDALHDVHAAAGVGRSEQMPALGGGAVGVQAGQARVGGGGARWVVHRGACGVGGRVW